MPVTFKKWIQQFINEDSPRGDLAVDVRDDAPFPNSKIYREIYDYLSRVGASELYMQSFYRAWKTYKGEIK